MSAGKVFMIALSSRPPAVGTTSCPQRRLRSACTSKTFSISQHHQIQLVSTYSLTWCDYPHRDTSIKSNRYKNGDMEAVRAFSVATIDCVSGRMNMGRWCGIIDHSIRPQQINIYDIQEPEYKLEDNLDLCLLLQLLHISLTPINCDMI